MLVGSEVVWQQQLTAQQLANRRIEFAVPFAPLYEILLKQLPKNVTHAVAPMQLTAQHFMRCRRSEQAEQSAVIEHFGCCSAFAYVDLGWSESLETRYLRNMFERDPAWEVNCWIATEASEFAFPKTRDELFQFDLIVLGDLPAAKLNREQVIWLREFVEMNGGELILIAGARRALMDEGYAELSKLFPIAWSSGKSASSVQHRLPKRIELTGAGISLAALRIDPRGEVESQKLWSELPALQFVDKVTPLPGSEVLAMAKCDVDNQPPLLVTRRFGAGRVLFAASDETCDGVTRLRILFINDFGIS